MKQIFFSIFFIILLGTCSIAQSSDLFKIETVIKELYFEGWMTGDTSKIGKAVHSTCHLKFYRDGKFNDISRIDYLSRFKPKAKDATTSGRIISIDITRNIAAAKCELETDKSIFTDYFNLIRIEDTWTITDKVSTRVDK
jgi:hypothetical protein